MKLLVLGLGTAGSRIADAIVRSVHCSSRTKTFHTIAVDNDPDVLLRLKYIEEEGKIFFPKDDLNTPGLLTTDFTIEEVTGKLKKFDQGDHDAVILCAGLGGGLIDLIPHLVRIIRETMIIPVFGLVTIPGISEENPRLQKAAENLLMARKLLDGVIVFDNQIWFERAKIKVQEEIQARSGSISEKIGIPGAADSELLDPYYYMNVEIARRIRLLIQAGEIQGHAPQIVLDTREILNTITGSDLITIGLAEEHLTEKNLLNRLIPKEESRVYKQERATRIVRLAEKAVLRDISAACDISTAKKALVLLIGPENELSMKGFMAVRKWLDESIAGYELRSGDYPISPRTGNYVAVLVVLSGLTTISRVQELGQFLPEKEEE